MPADWEAARAVAPDLEWAEVAPGKIVVAARTKAWLHECAPLGGGGPFSAPMVGAGGANTTRALLDGALDSGRRLARSSAGILSAPLTLTSARWAWCLCASYHTASISPAAMRSAAVRMRAAGRLALADSAEAVAREETGHDRLALRDLIALGYDARALVAALCPPYVRALTAYFRELVRSDDPIESLGYIYALERPASQISAQQVAQIEAMLPPGVFATRCLRVHSAIGSEGGHTADSVRLIAALDAADRIRIARACFQTALLYYRRQPADQPSDEALAALLAPFAKGAL